MIKKFFQKIKPKKPHNNYAFIDSQNLNLAINALGWKLDFRKLRVYLKEKFNVEKAFLFIGFVEGNEPMYKSLTENGYELIYKPTLERDGIVKGNCDAELVLQTMIELNNYEKAVIISGDGDFYCLYEYLDKHNKLFKIGIPNKRGYSSLIRKYAHYFFYVSDLRKIMNYGFRGGKNRKNKNGEHPIGDRNPNVAHHRDR